MRHMVGAQGFHWCQLNVDWAVETAAIQTKPACAGFKTLSSRQSAQADLVFIGATSSRHGLKLTRMKALRPYRWWFKGEFA